MTYSAASSSIWQYLDTARFNTAFLDQVRQLLLAALPEVLGLLDLSDSARVSIDALSCQPDIVR